MAFPPQPADERRAGIFTSVLLVRLSNLKKCNCLKATLWNVAQWVSNSQISFSSSIPSCPSVFPGCLTAWKAVSTLLPGYHRVHVIGTPPIPHLGCSKVQAAQLPTGLIQGLIYQPPSPWPFVSLAWPMCVQGQALPFVHLQHQAHPRDILT